MPYMIGDSFLLTGPQRDDDEQGNPRLTPSGSLVEVVAVVDENTVNKYLVGCPETGGQWFFSAEELSQHARLARPAI